MSYSYKFKLHPKRLVVAVHVGLQSEFNLDFPHLWTGDDEAEVWFPRQPISHSDVAHEGVHLTTWGVETLTPEEWDALVPSKGMARKKGRAAMREEAQARMMDRYIDSFYQHARHNGLLMLDPKV